MRIPGSAADHRRISVYVKTMKDEKTKLKICAAVNAIIFLMAAAVFLRMLFRTGNGTMSTSGLANLKYFTVLSNLFEGGASLAAAVSLGRVLSGKKERISRGAFITKLSAAACVTVTFLVVVVFLGPIYGYRNMYKGASFWYHLVIPVLAFAEFVLLEHFGEITRRDTIKSVIPVLLYGIVYTCNILINGPGEWPHRNDFYGFVLWGLPVGIAIFIGILLIGWAAALVLRALNRRVARKSGGRYGKTDKED